MTDKIKITKQEFEELYEIEEPMKYDEGKEETERITKELENAIPQNEIDADNKIEQEMFSQDTKDLPGTKEVVE